MIIAALIVFASLLLAWLVAPAGPRSQARSEVQLAPALGQEGLAEAA
jgi:hypothetical protein